MNRTVEVLITQPFSETLVQKLSNVSPRLKITVLKARKSDDIPDEIWANTEVLYTSRILPKPEQAPNLRWIQFHWAGIDHAIDAPIMKKPELVATNLSGAAASQMAEYALALLLAMGHHMPRLCSMHRLGEWPSDRWERFSPVELRDSTVGIVGYGSVGRQVARLLQSFGARVLAAKRDARHPEDTGFTPEGLGDPTGDLVQRLYPIQALSSMLKECDFILVCVPLTPNTRGLIGVKEFAVMKPTAYIVDLARGGVIDQEALIAALRENRLAGAALDVFTQEPLPPDNPLWKLSNVLLSPHVAGFSPHYDERAFALFSENLLRYLSGLELYNQVSLELGY
jgi:phosphoglycerate dehydrogenase-like enzyme